jgi:RNA polymerase sigma-70 factor (ECF subfamily)
MEDSPELIERARSGDTEAFGELVALHAPAVLKFISGLAWLTADEREDAAQEAFVRAFERFDQFQPGRSFPAWVAGFARFVVCEHLARLKRRAEMQKRLVEAAAAGAALSRAREADLLRTERRMEVLRHCIQSLPDPMRSVLQRHYHEGLSLADIAGALSRPVGTIKSLLHRSRQELRACMERKSESAWEPAP